MSTLTTADCAAYTTLLQLEHEAGQGVTLTQASLWDFMCLIDDFARSGYSAITDGELRGRIDTLLTGIVGARSSAYQQPMIGIYIAAQYGRFLKKFGKYYDPRSWAYGKDVWGWPVTPGYWHDAILNTLWSTWRDVRFPASLFGPWWDNRDVARQIDVEEKVLDPASWSDARALSALIDPIVAQQAAFVQEVVKAKSLAGRDAAMLLIHMIAALTSSRPADIRVVQRLVSASAPSPEYPNDVFVNQLVYVVLMQLTDPFGEHLWTNDQLKTFVANLAAVIRTTDPGSLALQKSLSAHLKILTAAASYPMVDPYAPAFSFPVRQTDTLSALETALQTPAADVTANVSGETPSRLPQDLAAMSTIARIQGAVGATTPTATGLLDFMNRLALFDWTGPSSTLTAPVSAMLGQLAALPTSYGYPFPALWVAYAWGWYIQTGFRDWYYQSVTYAEWAKIRAQVNPPAPGPQNFVQAVVQQFQTLPPGPVILDIDIGHRQENPQWAQNTMCSHQFGLFDPAKWTDVTQVAPSAPAIWTQQAADVRSMAGGTLDETACIRLLYALVGLSTSPKPADVQMVNRIAQMITTSAENPNDTFADQLLYCVLMLWADPRWTLGWSPTQIAAEVASLTVATPNTDPGSVLLQKTLNGQAAVLKSAPSYPMIDPYNPQIGFNQRKADTLAALNAAWSGFTP